MALGAVDLGGEHATCRRGAYSSNLALSSACTPNQGTPDVISGHPRWQSDCRQVVNRWTTHLRQAEVHLGGQIELVLFGLGHDRAAAGCEQSLHASPPRGIRRKEGRGGRQRRDRIGRASRADQQPPAEQAEVGAARGDLDALEDRFAHLERRGHLGESLARRTGRAGGAADALARAGGGEPAAAAEGAQQWQSVAASDSRRDLVVADLVLSCSQGPSLANQCQSGGPRLRPRAPICHSCSFESSSASEAACGPLDSRSRRRCCSMQRSAVAASSSFDSGTPDMSMSARISSYARAALASGSQWCLSGNYGAMCGVRSRADLLCTGRLVMPQPEAHGGSRGQLRIGRWQDGTREVPLNRRWQSVAVGGSRCDQ